MLVSSEAIHTLRCFRQRAISVTERRGRSRGLRVVAFRIMKRRYASCRFRKRKNG